MAEVKKNKYVLKQKKTRGYTILRQSKVFTNVKGVRKSIGYCDGESTIFKEKWHKDSTDTPQLFDGQHMEVDENNKVLNDYLQAHSDFGKKFFLYDEEKESKDKLTRFKEEKEVRQLLDGLDSEQMNAVAVVLFGMSTATKWGEDKTALECYEYAEDKNDLVSKKKRDKLKSVINDPATKIIYEITGAQKLNIIKVTADKTSWKWCDSENEIIPIARGENPLTALAQFFRTEEGMTTLQTVGEKVKGLKEIKLKK